MAVVRGCRFPDDLYYDVPRHTWYVAAENGLVRIGITPVGVALAREVLIFTPKRPGTAIEKDRSLATIESAKWVGAVRAAFDGTVETVNDALLRDASEINRDCYAAWMLLLKPASADWRLGLAAREHIAPAYEAWMEEEAFPGCGGAALA